MADLLPVVCNWNGETMQPIMGHKATAKKQFIIGETYIFEPLENRNAARHRAYFAYINQAWGSLTEVLLKEYPSPEHLRKRALIKTGYCTMTDFVCASKAEAIRTAAVVSRLNTYAIVQINGCVVRMFEAKSQSYRAMGKQRFNKSQEDVENWIEGLIITMHEGVAA